MSEKHLLIIDKLCLSCGYRNKINKLMDEKIEIIACGNCGRFIMTPTNIESKELELIHEVIQRELDGGT